jgi:hypothetical protein
VVQESCGCLTLTDKDPILVEKVLQYLYTGDYSVDPGMLRYDGIIILQPHGILTFLIDKEETGEISSDGTSIIRLYPHYRKVFQFRND